MNGFRLSSTSRNVDRLPVALPLVAGVLMSAMAVLLGASLAVLSTTPGW